MLLIKHIQQSIDTFSHNVHGLVGNQTSPEILSKVNTSLWDRHKRHTYKWNVYDQIISIIKNNSYENRPINKL